MNKWTYLSCCIEHADCIFLSSDVDRNYIVVEHCGIAVVAEVVVDVAVGDAGLANHGVSHDGTIDTVGLLLFLHCSVFHSVGR